MVFTRKSRKYVSIFIIAILLFGTVFSSFPNTIGAEGSGEIQFEIPEGYMFYGGDYYIGKIVNDPYGPPRLDDTRQVNINDGTLELTQLNLTIDDEELYFIQVAIEYTDVNYTERLVFFDERTLTGRDLLSMTVWSIPESANVVPITFQESELVSNRYLDIKLVNPYGQGLQKYFYINESNKYAILAESKTFNIRYSEIVETGLVGFIFDELVINEDLNSIDIEEMKKHTVEVSFYNGVNKVYPQSISIFKNNSNIAFFNAPMDSRIEAIHVTPGAKEIDFTINEETSDTVFNWSTGEVLFVLGQEKKFQFTGVPEELQIENFNILSNTIYASVEVKSGDLLLKSYYDNGNKVIRSESELLNGNLEIIKKKENEYWKSGTIDLDNELQSGSYIYKYSLHYPGVAVPMEVSRQFTIQKQDHSDINGVLVEAENELGEPLGSGELYLFEKKYPQVYEAMEPGQIIYDLALIFEADLQDGEAFIPNAYLLEDKEYALLVLGTSTDGKDILYHLNITADDLDRIQFTKDHLTKVTISTNIDFDEAKLVLSVLDPSGRYDTFPSIHYMSESKAVDIYIGTENKVAVEATLYEKESKTGYLLSKQFTPIGASMEVNLDQDMVPVTVSSDFYDSVQLMARKSTGSNSPFVNHLYVTDVESQFLFVDVIAKKSEYDFSFFTSLTTTGVNRERYEIKLGNKLTGRLARDYVLQGEGTSKLSTVYQDEFGNQLMKVSKNGINSTTNDTQSMKKEVSFMLQGDNGNPITMKAERVGNEVTYSVQRVSEQLNAQSNEMLAELEYGIYDSDKQQIGESITSNQFTGVEVPIPKIAGIYGLKLLNHNLPSEFGEVNFADNQTFTVIPTTSTPNYKVIEVDVPTGYYVDNINGLLLGIVTVNGQYEESIRFYSQYTGDSKKLNFNLLSGINVDEYILLFDARMRDSSFNSFIYFDQINLTKEELENFSKIPLNKDVVKIKPTIQAPKITNNKQLMYEYYVDGLDEVYLFSDYFGSSPSVLWTTPKELRSSLVGTDGGENAYFLTKEIVIDANTSGFNFGPADFSNLKKITIQTDEKKVSFKEFWLSKTPNTYSSTGYYYPYYLLALTTLNATPGVYQGYFQFIEIQNQETPWLYRWNVANIDARSDIQLNKPVTINYKAIENLDIFNMVSGNIVINGNINIRSGDFKLAGVDVYRESNNIISMAQAKTTREYDGDFNSRLSVSATITIKNDKNETVYKGETTSTEWIYVNTKLDPGTYTLFYSLPFAPKESIHLSKSFVVGGSGIKKIVIDSPTGEIITNNSKVTVLGTTEPNTSVTIEAYLGTSSTPTITQQVDSNDNGTFSAQLQFTQDGVYRVFAYVTEDSNIKSAPVFITIDTTAPSKPVITIQQKENGLLVTWAEDADVQFYQVYAAEKGQELELVKDQLKNHEFLYEGIKPGTTYQFQVVAFDRAGNSVTSDIKEFTTPEFVATNLDVTSELSSSGLLKIGSKLQLVLEGSYEQGYTATAQVTYLDGEGQKNKNVELTYVENEPTSSYQGEFLIQPGITKIVSVQAWITNPETSKDTNKLTKEINKEVGATLEGVITAGQEKLTESATVRFYSSTRSYTVETDQVGNFKVEGLPAGGYVFNVTYKGETLYNALNKETNLSFGNVTNVSIYLPAYQKVMMKFVDIEDEIVQNQLYVQIQGTSDGNRHYLTSGYIKDGYFTQWTGKNTLERVPVGSYEVIIYGSGIYMDTTENIVVDNSTDYISSPIEITVKTLTKDVTDVTVRFEDQNGTEIKNITTIDYYSLYSSAVSYAFGYELGSIYAYGDQIEITDGKITIPDVILADDYYFSIKVPGYSTFNDSYRITNQNHEIVVTLDPGVKVIATLQTDDGKELLNPTAYAYTSSSYVSGYIDGNGTLIFEGLKSGEDITYQISAIGYQTIMDVIDVSGHNGKTTIDLGDITLYKEGYIHGKVVDKDNKPVKNVYLSAYDEKGNYGGSTRTDSNGYFKIRGLVSGKTYTVHVSGYPYPNFTVEEIAKDEEISIVLTDKRVGAFTGAGNTLTANVNSITPGKTIQYRLDYKNNSGTDLTDVEIKINVPDEVDLDADSLLLNGVPVSLEADGKVTLAKVGKDEAGVLLFSATVEDDADKPITTTVTVSGNVLSHTTQVLFVTLHAPEQTSAKAIKVYGKAKPGSKVEVYAGDIRVATVEKVERRWWFADVILPVSDLQISENFTLLAKVIDQTNTFYSEPVSVYYNPDIPKISDVEVSAGWNGIVNLNPYTGVATFAITEMTPIPVKVDFDREVDEAYISFLGEEYPLTRTNNGLTFTGGIPAGWSSYGEQLLEITFKKGDLEITLPLMEIIVLIDPSGYVFEGSMDNPIQGVTAVVYEQQADSSWKKWNADFYGQVNPQITDAEGRYAWDVIHGKWRVQFSKDGYETYTSRIVEVPPAETQLNVPLVRTTEPQVAQVTPANNATNVDVDQAIEIEFDRLMKQVNMPTLIKFYEVTSEGDVEVNGTFTFEDRNGYKVDTTKGKVGFEDSNGQTGWFVVDETVKLSQKVVFTPEQDLGYGKTYKLVIGGTIADYAGKVLGDDAEYTFTTKTKAADPDPGNGGGGPIIIPGDSGGTTTTPATDYGVIDAKNLSTFVKNGTITFKLADDQKGVSIDQEAWKEIATKGYKVVVQTTAGNVVIPPKAITLQPGESLLLKAETTILNVPAGYTIASEVLRITLAKAKEGKEEAITSNEMLQIELQPNKRDKAALAGLYKVNGNSFTYVGRKASAQFDQSSTYVLLVYTRPFTDINNHWAKDDIAYLVSHHIMNGISDTSFAPNKQITRAEFAKIIAELLQLDMSNTDSSFNDVTGNEWFAAAVAAVAKAGIFQGSDGYFRPNDPITRQEMAIVIAKLLKSKQASELNFKDQDKIASWAKEAVAIAVANGIILGDDNNNFRPADFASRAEAVTMIRRFIKLLDANQ